ncbi:MAG TPA: response regulator [Thermomicrobiaceae bacterium]|nr:response regulator [Thermomicrobiaceae bacterium]
MSKTVLLVEDDPSLREVIGEILRLDGYEVMTAADGLEAIDILGRRRPHIILLDMMMPRMDGIAFAAEVSRRGIQIPTIVLTADNHAQQKAEQIGAEGYVEKPFAIPTLLAMVSRHAAT